MPPLLAPRWLVGHALTLAGAAVMLRLGRWQLDRAHHTHSLQNWSYAVEWVLFAGFTVVAYAKIARDEVRGGQVTAAPRPAVSRGAPVVVPTVVSEDDDPELAAYNRYLAELNARSEA